MTLYKIEFVKSAKKEFDHLPAPVKKKTLDALSLLAINPYTEILNIKKLKGATDLFRVRLGDYRLVYEIRAQIVTVVVIKIGHRKDVYR